MLEVSHPSLSPYLPEAHLAALEAAIAAREPDLVLLENTTAGYDLAAAVAARSARPFVGYCLELSLEAGEAQAVCGVYGGQLHATVRTPLPAVVAVNSTALTEEPVATAGSERVVLPAPAGAGEPADDVRRVGSACPTKAWT